MMEKKSKIKLLLLKTLLLKVVYGSLCVYNSQGTIKFDDLTVNDIEYAYSKLEYFIGNNPFNTYFGDCVNDQELINIFGIQAEKSHHSKNKRRNYKSFLDQYNLENDKVCNLLVGQEADSNPYSKELTGLVNPNLLEGWKAVKLANITFAGGSSIAITKAYSFDDIYSLSIQDSSFENDAYTIENDYSSSDENNNFCSTISRVMEESLVNTMINDEDNHLKNSIMNDISKINEDYSKDYWCRKDSSSHKANTSDESKGTSDEYIAGNSENNGGSKIKSESVSISESMLKSNLELQSIKNAIDRSTSNVQNFVGYIKKDGRKCAHSNSNLDPSYYASKSYSVNYNINFNITDGDEVCELELFKKVTKLFNVVSCHDLDDKNKNSKNTKSLQITNIDFELLEKIQKAQTSEDNKKISLRENSVNFISPLLQCSNHKKEKVSFTHEDNEFIRVKKMTEENNGVNKYYRVLPSYLELSSHPDNSRIKTIKNMEDDNIANVLTNSNGNIILKKGKKEIFNTLTGTVSKNAILRISNKNHLEVYVNEEDIFEPVGTYASEFKTVSYALPVVNETLVNENDYKNVTEIASIEKRSTKDLEKLLDPSNFNVPEVVVWSSVRPEHQHLTVGWSGNEDGNEFSYLVINTRHYNDSTSYDGMTLYDPNGIPIWMLDILHPNKNNDYLDSHGYYLPFKYGYPFKNEEITKNIPKKYAEKKYPYLTIPDNVTYKGNTLYYGGCDNSLTSGKGSLEGLISENGRFRLILKEDGNLVFKDHQVTIWESKTSNLWQGKDPYTLIVGNDGVMRILNSLNEVILSTINKDVEPHKKYANYRLEILNAGTFRIVNEKGEEVWNMWNHADYHEFSIYLEKVTYSACERQARNTNLPYLVTISEKNSIMRVGEQLINQFTEEQYERFLENVKYEHFINDSDYSDYINFNFSQDYEFDQNNHYYYTARLVLSSNSLQYQNKYTIDSDFKEIEYSKDNQMELIPITDKNSAIAYGKLNRNGLFNLDNRISDENNRSVSLTESNRISNKPHNETLLNECKRIKEFPCITLNPDGVYFLNNSEPYFKYEMKSNSTLYLDYYHGYLSLDGIDILGLKNENIPLPTRLQCDIINDKYTIKLIDNNNFIIWQYQNVKNLQLTNEKFNNTMIVDDSLYYFNQKCLDFQSNGLVNGNGTRIVEFPSVTKGSLFYMNETQITIINENGYVNIPIIKYNNPQNHSVALTCKAKDKAVVIDRVTGDILWSYPPNHSLPEFNNKKYEITAHDHLYYGEKLYKKGFNGTEEEACLLFDNDRLYTNYGNYTIENFESENKWVKRKVKQSYISIDDRGIALNNTLAYAIYNVTNVSENTRIVGKCMDYHGHNKFVLYNSESTDVLVEFPPVENKVILKGNDTIYDKLYVDHKYREPCVRIQNIDQENSNVGLFFHDETKSIVNLASVPSIHNNNTLRFDKGLLLLNGISLFNETFKSNQLQMQCKMENGKLYVTIEDEENGKEYWRYPSILKRNSISSLNEEKWFVGESLYDERYDNYVNLTEYGILAYNITENDQFYNQKLILQIADKKDKNLLQYLYWEKKKGSFQLNVFKDDGHSDTIIEVENISNAQYVLLKFNEKYGYYIEDEFGNILKKSNSTDNDNNHNNNKNKINSNTFYSNINDGNNVKINKFNVGQKIMCENEDYGLILKKSGFMYRYIEDDEKNEKLFKGQLKSYSDNDNDIVDAYFDDENNFVLKYKDGEVDTLVHYVNHFNNISLGRKDLRISCNNDNGKIEFIETVDNEDVVYYDYPKSKETTTIITNYSTSTSTKYSTLFSTKTQTSIVTKTKSNYETYTYVTYLGTVGSKYILGVDELKEYSTIKASYGGMLNKNESKYTRWLVKSTKDTPSKMILAIDNGDLSNYCLDVGKATGDSYYLAITKCSKAKYLFKYYNVPFTDSNGLNVTKSPVIGIFKNANTLLTNEKGIPFCVYYSDTLYVKECKYTKDYPKYKWATVIGRDKTHIHTTTTTKIQIITNYITTSTVKFSVVTNFIPTVITTKIPITTTKYTPTSNNIITFK